MNAYQTRVLCLAVLTIFTTAGCDVEDANLGVNPPLLLDEAGGRADAGVTAANNPDDRQPPADQTPGTQPSDENMTPSEPEPEQMVDNGLACMEIIGCFNECPQDQRECLDNCFESGTEGGQTALRDLSRCMQTNNCNDQDCIDENCLWEWRVCESDGGGAPAEAEPQPEPEPEPAGEGLTCNEIFGCFNECNQGDRDCTDACFESGFPSGRRAVQGIGACIRANDCQDQGCIESNCAAQIRICNEDDGLLDVHQPDGRDLTCREIEACFSTCNGDGACLDRCYNSGSTDAREALSSIGACARQNDCNDQRCLDTHCAAENHACETDAPAAAEAPPEDNQQLNCMGITRCFDDCPAGDRACTDVCFNRGTPDAQNAIGDIGACIQERGCRDEACIDRECAAEVAACEAQGQGNPGQANAEPNRPEGLSCIGIIGCFNECADGNRECLNGCFGQGHPAGQDALNDLSECLQTNQCQDDECMQARCGNEWNACEATDVGAEPAPAEPAGEPAPQQQDALECVDVYQCFGGCEDNDCRRACYDAGSDQGRNEVDAVSDCVREHECRDDDCARDNCGNEIEACESPDGAEPAEPEVEEPEEPAEPEAEEPEAEEPEAEEPEAEEPEAEEPEADGTCSAPFAAELGRYEGHTGDGQSVERGQCGGGGAEQVFRLNLDSGTVVCADTVGSAFDTVLYVRQNTCQNHRNEVGCNDDAYGLQSRLSFRAEADTDYFIIVDSYNASGNFSLNLSSGACR